MNLTNAKRLSTYITTFAFFLCNMAMAYEEIHEIEISSENIGEFEYDGKEFRLIGLDNREIPFVLLSDAATVLFYEDVSFRQNSANGSCKFFIGLVAQENQELDENRSLYFVPAAEDSSPGCEAFKREKAQLDKSWEKSLVEADSSFRQSLGQRIMQPGTNCLGDIEVSFEELYERNFRFKPEEIDKLSTACCKDGSIENTAIVEYISFPHFAKNQERTFDKMHFATSPSEILDQTVAGSQ